MAQPCVSMTPQGQVHTRAGCKYLRGATVALLSLAELSCVNLEPKDGTEDAIEPIIVGQYPHDTTAFTQGLVFAGDRLFESTGIRGESTLRELEPRTGEVLRQHPLEARFFGEGLAVAGDQLVQLTWTAGLALIWRMDDFTLAGQWHYEGQGWGLCFNGRQFVMSDGSDELSLHDPGDFSVVGTVPVLRGGRPQSQLNELECVGSHVLANVWQSSEIVRIELDTGEVTDIVDAQLLSAAVEGSGASVLNGIAFDAQTGRYWLTGKRWPTLFEVELPWHSSAFEATTGGPDQARRPRPAWGRLASYTSHHPSPAFSRAAREFAVSTSAVAKSRNSAPKRSTASSFEN